MNDVQRRVDVQIDAQILAEIIRRDIKTLSEHVGEMGLRAETKVQGDIEDRRFAAAQLIDRAARRRSRMYLPSEIPVASLNSFCMCHSE